MKLRDRIVELRRVPASELLPNPKNWRTHPEAQKNALRGVLSEIGIADAVLCRETPDGLQIIDGHCRAEIAGDVVLPVLILDVNDDEANKLLATLDPLAAMAGVDAAKLDELLATVDTASDDVRAVLDSLSKPGAGGGESGDVSHEGDGEIQEVEPPTLPGGDRQPFQQMTFTLHDSQAETIKAAIKRAKGKGAFDGPNENSNGNALARIAESYNG